MRNNMYQHCDTDDSCILLHDCRAEKMSFDNGISIWIFREKGRGRAVREEWEAANFIHAVNGGDYRVEFITRYKSYQSLLFKCWVWFDKAPYHRECEIILHTENVAYRWNRLRYERKW